jgi:2-hydroxychromene-2-carboxylate isomerase
VARLEFFFDCSSPWTYLAFERVQPLAARTGAELIWRPILVGGVFNAVNGSVYEQRANPVPQKARYYAKDLGDWARHVGVKIGRPTPFPVNSVKAMRGCFVAEEHGCLPGYARAVFEAYWSAERDISQDTELGAVVERVGLPRDEYFAKIASPEYKEKLRRNTDELIERGGFGSPTLFVDGADMYFGNDRLELVREALERAGGARRV